LDTQDSGSNGNNAQVYQIANPAANYGPSEFDTRNAFKGRVVYLLPVGMGRRFLSNSHILDLGLGGWQLAGTAVVMSGNPFTPVIDSPNNSYSLGGWWYPNVMGNPKLAHPSIQQWFNPAAFTSPADGTFGDMQRDSVYGPGMSEINLSAGKTFSIREGVNLLIRRSELRPDMQYAWGAMHRCNEYHHSRRSRTPDAARSQTFFLMTPNSVARGAVPARTLDAKTGMAACTTAGVIKPVPADLSFLKA